MTDLNSRPMNLGLISIQFVRVFFSAVDVETAVEHQLGRVAVAAFPVAIDKAAILRMGQMPSAPTVSHLVSNTAEVTATICVVAVNVSER